MTERERWEARLKSEGLGHLDTVHGDGIGVSNRGSGTPKDQATHDHRAENEAEIDSRRARIPHAVEDIQARSAARFGATPTQLRIRKLHAEGLGYRQIAMRLRTPEHAVRAAITRKDTGATGAVGAAVEKLVPLADTVVLLKLALVLA